MARVDELDWLAGFLLKCFPEGRFSFADFTIAYAAEYRVPLPLPAKNRDRLRKRLDAYLGRGYLEVRLGARGAIGWGVLPLLGQKLARQQAFRARYGKKQVETLEQRRAAKIQRIDFAARVEGLTATIDELIQTIEELAGVVASGVPPAWMQPTLHQVIKQWPATAKAFECLRTALAPRSPDELAGFLTQTALPPAIYTPDRKGWSEIELEILKENFGTVDMPVLRALLPGRSKKAIVVAANRMKLTMGDPTRKAKLLEFTTREIDIVTREWTADKPASDIAPLLPGRSEADVRELARILKLKRTDSSAVLSRASKRRHDERRALDGSLPVPKRVPKAKPDTDKGANCRYSEEEIAVVTREYPQGTDIKEIISQAPTLDKRRISGIVNMLDLQRPDMTAKYSPPQAVRGDSSRHG